MKIGSKWTTVRDVLSIDHYCIKVDGSERFEDGV